MLISKGSEFVKVDFRKMKQLGYDNSTIILVLHESLGDNKIKMVVKEGQIVRSGDVLFKIIP